MQGGGGCTFNKMPTTKQWAWACTHLRKVRHVRPDGSCAIWAIAQAAGRLINAPNDAPHPNDLDLERTWREAAAQYAQRHANTHLELDEIHALRTGAVRYEKHELWQAGTELGVQEIYAIAQTQNTHIVIWNTSKR